MRRLIWAVSSGSVLFAKAYYYRLWQWKWKNHIFCSILPVTSKYFVLVVHYEQTSFFVVEVKRKEYNYTTDLDRSLYLSRVILTLSRHLFYFFSRQRKSKQQALSSSSRWSCETCPTKQNNKILNRTNHEIRHKINNNSNKKLNDSRKRVPTIYFFEQK